MQADLKKEVEDKIAELKKILDSGSKEDLEAKTKDLSDSLQKVGQAMSQQQPGQQPGQQAGGDGEAKKEEESSSAKASEDKPVEGEVVN